MTDAADHITLRGMRFAGRHGALPGEQATPQPFEVDIAVTLDLAPAAASDDLDDTVDYRALFDLAQDIVENRSFRLIEAMAGAIADAVLAAHDVDEVEVAVRKPQAPLPGDFETVEVRVRRLRGEPAS
ncbi:MAG: dihydroneopterin aldolase [Chloroflexota bacterium]|nr:dihydroneopterin aldolase [Chloroflexota bacterium]